MFKAIYDNYPEQEVIDLLSAYDFLDNNPQLSTVNEKVVQKELDPEIVRKIDDYYLSKKENKFLQSKREFIIHNNVSSGTNRF